MMDQRSFENLSDGELCTLRDACIKEMQRREAHQKAELIEEFRKAWNALRAHSVRVDYYPDEYDDDYITISDWDQFDFI